MPDGGPVMLIALDGNQLTYKLGTERISVSIADGSVAFAYGSTREFRSWCLHERPAVQRV